LIQVIGDKGEILCFLIMGQSCMEKKQKFKKIHRQFEFAKQTGSVRIWVSRSCACENPQL